MGQKGLDEPAGGTSVVESADTGGNVRRDSTSEGLMSIAMQATDNVLATIAQSDMAGIQRKLARLDASAHSSTEQASETPPPTFLEGVYAAVAARLREVNREHAAHAEGATRADLVGILHEEAEITARQLLAVLVDEDPFSASIETTVTPKPVWYERWLKTAKSMLGRFLPRSSTEHGRRLAGGAAGGPVGKTP